MSIRMLHKTRSESSGPTAWTPPPSDYVTPMCTTTLWMLAGGWFRSILGGFFREGVSPEPLVVLAPSSLCARTANIVVGCATSGYSHLLRTGAILQEAAGFCNGRSGVRLQLDAKLRRRSGILSHGERFRAELVQSRDLPGEGLHDGYDRFRENAVAGLRHGLCEVRPLGRKREEDDRYPATLSS